MGPPKSKRKTSNKDQPRIYARTWVGGKTRRTEFKNSLGYIGRGQSGRHETLSSKNKKQNKKTKN